MTTQQKSFKNISGGSRNNVLPIYIHYKIPKSLETVPLRQTYDCMHILQVKPDRA
jgi:hypothetical protein